MSCFDNSPHLGPGSILCLGDWRQGVKNDNGRVAQLNNGHFLVSSFVTHTHTLYLSLSHCHSLSLTRREYCLNKARRLFNRPTTEKIFKNYNLWRSNRKIINRNVNFFLKAVTLLHRKINVFVKKSCWNRLVFLVQILGISFFFSARCYSR